MALDPTQAQRLVVALTETETPADTAAAAKDALNFFLKQLEELRELANGYPHNPISGAVWFGGRDLTHACDALTGALAERGLPREEELASRIAAGMACQVLSHYPHEIFPRVLRNGLCREAIDQIEEARGCYESILGDFDALELSYLLDENEPLEAMDRPILEAVSGAADRLVEIEPAQVPVLQELRAALKDRLSKGKPSSREAGEERMAPEAAVARLVDILATRAEFTEDDVYAEMAETGIPDPVADRAYKFTQVAAGRVLLEGLGVQLNPDYLCFNAAGEVIESGPLAEQPYFVAGLAVARRRPWPDGLERLALMSAEVSMVNSALKKGSKPTDLVTTPTALFMEPLTPEGTEKAQRLLSDLISELKSGANQPSGPAARTPDPGKKPWWRFW